MTVQFRYNLSQSRFPTLWMIFQYILGGTVDKRKLCLLNFDKQNRVLEVGCSLGNIASAFKNRQIDYTGIDTDPVVVGYAKKKFRRYANFNFYCSDVGKIKFDYLFDYVIIAGVLHHIDDETAYNVLQAVTELSESQATITIVDPLLPTDNDSWLVKNYIKLEQGQYLRNDEQVKTLLKDISCLSLINSRIHYITGTPFPFFKCAKFGVYQLGK